MKELKDSMDTIRLTAADFLEKLEAAVAERSAERMTAMQYAEKLIANLPLTFCGWIIEGN